jgi:predicted CXXCH cytochrome family protein
VEAPHPTELPADSAHAAWTCEACHIPEEARYKLVVTEAGVTGEPTFLCYQCHSDTHKLWQDGKHHDVEKDCTDAACHDPHSPRLEVPPALAGLWFLELLPVPAVSVVILAALAPIIAVCLFIFYKSLKKRKEEVFV